MDWNPLNWPSDFFKAAGGDIASGLSAGLMAFFKELWDVTAGPLYVMLGFAVGVIVVAIYVASGKEAREALTSAAMLAVK